ncbi:MAG: arginine--tRNA ligase [Anaerolineae bacterium]
MLLEDLIGDIALTGARAAQASGALPAFELPVSAPVARSKNPEWGDFSTALAMQLAGSAHMAPLEIAQAIEAHLPADDLVGSTSVTPPGFLNFTVAPRWLAGQVDRIAEAGTGYADLDSGAGRSAQVEYVSANPTGPLTVGHGRGGVIGDTVANALEAAGFDVTREFYFNNAGSQMRRLGESYRCRYLQALGDDVDVPEDGYKGQYLVDMAELLAAERGGELRDQPWETFKDLAEAELTAGQRETLRRVAIEMDVYFNEHSLYDDGTVWQTVDDLRERGFAYDRDGAVWFKATALGGAEDRVIVRSSGEPTYRLPDIAYHVNKLGRGFDLVIDVLGADHKDAFPDVRRGVEALGLDPEPIKILMNQFVTVKGARMSKRAGHFTTLDELLDEVPGDVVRFFLLMRAPESHLEFDLDLALEQSDKNPVYYVQYAHARVSSILRLARERGFTTDGADVTLLTHPSELALIRRLLELSTVIDRVAEDLTPHTLTTYARDLASDFHAFYRDCRVLDEGEPELSRARLRLVEASRIGLARALDLVGVSAPEEM